jgi:hypothetical protein
MFSSGPITYAQWTQCLDLLASGLHDDSVLAQMEQGTLSWSGGVGPLFAQRISDEFTSRLTRCSQLLTRDLSASTDDASVVRAILNARQTLYFLHRIAQLTVFADTLRMHLTGEVRKFAERSQQSLEDSARADRSGRLRLLLRHNNLLRYDCLVQPVLPPLPDASTPTVPPSAMPLNGTPTGARHRRNILS